MVTYIEVSNVFRAVGDGTGAEQYLIFIADNALVVECGDKSTIKLNSVVVEAATIFFNDAVSFVPCFKCAFGTRPGPEPATDSPRPTRLLTARPSSLY